MGACLSLSGRYARFGRQAERGLEIWRSMDGAADLVVADDRSDPRELEGAIRGVAARCDVLLGPYSTQLMRVAGRIAAEAGWLLWNHGGSGDDAQTAHPGHVVSVLTPASRYAGPFLRLLAANGRQYTKLWIAQGKGSFGRQVSDGAEAMARELGIGTVRVGPGGALPSVDPPRRWTLFSAGTFEDDVRMVRLAQKLRHPPQTICAVAAGVNEFGDAVDDPDGIYGIGQWFPGSGCSRPALGPAEEEFLAAYSGIAGVLPDYPAVQAVAGAVLAAHCARNAAEITRDTLWRAASELETTTLFGPFRINPASGAQDRHETTLVRWAGAELVAA